MSSYDRTSMAPGIAVIRRRGPGRLIDPPLVDAEHYLVDTTIAPNARSPAHE